MVPSPNPSESPSIGTPAPSTNPTMAPPIAAVQNLAETAIPTDQAGLTAVATASPQPFPSPYISLTISRFPTPKPIFGAPTASPAPTAPSAAPTESPRPTPFP